MRTRYVTKKIVNTTHCRIYVFILFMFIFSARSDEVKLTKAGICHDSTSPSFDKIKVYKSFSNIDTCLNFGGHVPKNFKKNTIENVPNSSSYHRSAFHHWSGSCPNTRHKILAEQSTSTYLTYTNKRNCTTDRGRWLDLYTNKTYYKSSELDIDHIVPLEYSWERGSKYWSTTKREKFANDNANLVITAAKLNRSKGAKGPMDWLPPRTEYRCQYLLRFDRVMKTYQLTYKDNEDIKIKNLLSKYCNT